MSERNPVTSKINVAAAAAILVSILPQVSTVVAGFLPPDKAAWVTGLLGGLVVILRSFSRTEQLSTQPDRVKT